MENSNPISLSANSIIDILTLRYNRENNPVLSKLEWDDFSPTNVEASIEFIQRSIKKTLQNSIDTKCEKVSIALQNVLLREFFIAVSILMT